MFNGFVIGSLQSLYAGEKALEADMAHTSSSPSTGVMAARIKTHDWASTPLGPSDAWPPPLRFALDMILSSAMAQSLFWGPELIRMHNDAYNHILGGGSDALGRPLHETWSEATWQAIGPFVARAMAGESTLVEDFRIEIERSGHKGEAWFTFCFNPVCDESGAVLGLISSVFETTTKVQLARKMNDERKNIVQLFEQSPSFLAFMRGPQHILEYVNPAYRALVGERELIGLSNAEAIPESVDQGFVALLDQVFESGKAVTVNGARYDRQITTGGPVTELYVDFVFQPIIEADGAISGILVQGEDVTDQFLAHQALRESRHQLQQITESIPQQIWAAQPDGRIDYINGQMTGYVGEFTRLEGGVSLKSMIHPDDVLVSMQTWQRALQTGDAFEIEQRLFHEPSHNYRWNLTRALPLRNEAGEIVRWFGTNTDIEDQRDAMGAIIEARDAAEAASIDKSAFLSRLSHDIRSPMGTVVNLSDFLAASQPLTADQSEYIRFLKIAASTVVDQISELIDVARADSRTADLEVTPFSLPEIAQDIANIVASLTAQKGLSFSVNIRENATRTLLGDPGRVIQIISHLCNNAIKFTQDGGLSLSLDVLPDRDKRNAVILSIVVTDTGIGMDAEKLATLFTPSVQSDGRLRRAYGGTGLGLSITRTLVEMMGGTISVQSQPDEGSVFTVHLPLRLAATGEPSADMLPPLAAYNGKVAQSVLLVEDYEPNLLVATTLLEQLGFRVDVALDGYRAVEKARDNSYCVALMDVNMPGMNGLEATQQIRRDEDDHGRARLPIIGVTAHSLGGDRELCLASGMDDYLAKPFEATALYARIQSVLQLAEADHLLD